MGTLATTARRILVVDDNPLVCVSIRRMLEVDGHNVLIATSGKAAMALFQRDVFDLILVDYLMPGMNGDELAGAIKALDPKPRVAMITAYSEVLNTSGKLPDGVDLMLSKPLELQQLRNAIKQLFQPKS
jgi:CheY-like chemotaxis protein